MELVFVLYFIYYADWYVFVCYSSYFLIESNGTTHYKLNVHLYACVFSVDPSILLTWFYGFGFIHSTKIKLRILFVAIMRSPMPMFVGESMIYRVANSKLIACNETIYRFGNNKCEFSIFFSSSSSFYFFRTYNRCMVLANTINMICTPSKSKIALKFYKMKSGRWISNQVAFESCARHKGHAFLSIFELRAPYAKTKIVQFSNFMSSLHRS